MTFSRPARAGREQDLRQLYPELEPYTTGFVEADGHSVYMEQSGNMQGVPVVFLHGGPGSGCNENHRRYFNPELYRIILFDQRGCNRSRPVGGVEHNTTQDLLNDMERIRTQLGIEKWVIFGGSWGATLALLYAESCPGRVLGLILRGTFLARRCDLDWFVRQGVNRIFPDYWQELIGDFPPEQRDDLISALHERVFSENKKAIQGAARAWVMWTGRVVTSSLGGEYALDDDEIDKLINDVRIEAHYARNHYFISENQILDNIARVPDVPVTLIHGRHDLTCLPESSWLLHRALPAAELVFLPQTGHLAGEPAMADALLRASDAMVKRLG